MTLEAWKLDGTRSGIRFSVRHLLIAKISGRFARWTGSVQVEEGEIDFASLELAVDAASIDTGLARRDLYLRSLHFLNVAAYPALTFAARRVDKGFDDRLRIVGEMTIRGGTREVILEVEDCVRSRNPEGTEHASFSLKTSVDRRDFGLTWHGALDSRATLLSDHVDIDLEVDAARMTVLEQTPGRNKAFAPGERRASYGHPGPTPRENMQTQPQRCPE